AVFRSLIRGSRRPVFTRRAASRSAKRLRSGHLRRRRSREYRPTWKPIAAGAIIAWAPGLTPRVYGLHLGLPDAGGNDH
ncbi:MAG: hypothetical protein U9N19_08190, partial [Thermodesulfobacteriota bacterium]|nr:hypothetical protein [Thermodesulfobacteriota bacterium]